MECLLGVTSHLRAPLATDYECAWVLMRATCKCDSMLLHDTNCDIAYSRANAAIAGSVNEAPDSSVACILIYASHIYLLFCFDFRSMVLCASRNDLFWLSRSTLFCLDLRLDMKNFNTRRASTPTPLP